MKNKNKYRQMDIVRAGKHDDGTEKPFGMNRREAARFIADHESEILSVGFLRGRCEDLHDALSEVKCKVLGSAIGNGEVLKFTKNQLREARTYSKWIVFFAGYARPRVNIIRAQRDAWLDLDIMSPEFGLRADFDGGVDGDMSEMDRLFVSSVESGDEKKPMTSAEPDAEEMGGSPESHDKEPPRWLKEQRFKRAKILKYIFLEQARHHGPEMHPIDHRWLCEEVRKEVVRIADAAGHSRRDIACYVLATFGELSAKEVLKEMPELSSTSNVDRIKAHVRASVVKAALLPGSRLAFLYAA